MRASSLRLETSSSARIASWCGDLAQEVLLARGAEEVVVAVAVADVVERVLALDLLVARLHVDRRVGLARGGGRVVVVVAAVDVDVDPADVVDRALEAAEVDVDDVVDREVLARGVLEQALDRVERLARPADLVGGVDLARPRARDLDLQVARDRHHRDPLGVGVDAHEQDRVRARLDLELAVAVALVGAEDQERARVTGLGARDLRDVDRGAGPRATNSSTTSSISSSTAEATAVADSEIVRIAGDQRADEHAATRVRNPVALHARPPSTRASR